MTVEGTADAECMAAKYSCLAAVELHWAAVTLLLLNG
jgi:hypothetical protein